MDPGCPLFSTLKVKLLIKQEGKQNVSGLTLKLKNTSLLKIKIVNYIMFHFEFSLNVLNHRLNLVGSPIL